MFGLGLAGTRRLLYWVLDSASYLQLDLLSEVRADSGRLIVVELDKALIPASVALLQEDEDCQANELKFCIELINDQSCPIDSSPPISF